MHPYTLQPYAGTNSRYTCPACQAKGKTFSRYIDTATGMQLAPQVGRCSREFHCGYHYTPRQFFADQGRVAHRSIQRPTVHTIPKPPGIIPYATMWDTMYDDDHNNLALYLRRLFGEQQTRKLIERYIMGRSTHWQGATIFWQLDADSKIRAGKIMLYDAETGKRVKEPFPHITWVHSVQPMAGYSMQQCLFGEHLLGLYKDKPVAIVESEKTALIAGMQMPEYVWLACGSLGNLSAEQCKVLKGRRVVLYPDVGAYDRWNAKVPELSKLARISIYNGLELTATAEQREQGWDIADYLVADMEGNGSHLLTAA